MNWKVVHAFWNPPFIGGVALLALGSSPLLIFSLLQELGYFPGNTGLGFGLLFFITALPSLALIVGGVVVAVKRVDAGRGKGAA